MANKKANSSNGANLGFEASLWAAADKLRSNTDAAEYKHVVLGLIFLKYVSDAFEEKHAKLMLEDKEFAEENDAYASENIFWVPKEARWSILQANAKQPDIGTLVDDAMDTIERENSSLMGVLPKQYARLTLDKQRLGELIDLIGTIGLGDKVLRKIAVEIAGSIAKNATIDWDKRENVRARMRLVVKKILRKYDYPPDKQEKAVRTVMEQAEVTCRNVVEALV